MVLNLPQGFSIVATDTVRKWLYRFRELGYDGLSDISHRPHHSPNKTPEDIAHHLVNLKRKYKRIGAEQIKLLENVPVSSKTMRKIWREQGISSRKRRRKYVTKNNLGAFKKEFALFQHVCEDTKYLQDIPEYWQYMKKYGLPTVQYTFREVSSSDDHLGFSDSASMVYSTLFSDYLQNNLKTLGIDLSTTTRQTDNGF